MKKNLGPANLLYPMPIVLVGAMCDGKPNYMPAAHVGIIDFEHLSVSLGRTHHTNKGVREHQAFSVNLPSVDLVEKVDYCGLVSGKNTDKADLFTNFFGEATGAPMIEECPVNMECRVTEVLERPRHEVFIGRVAASYCDEAILAGDAPDLKSLKPLLFAMNDKGYWELGPRLANAWSVGKELKRRR